MRILRLALCACVASLFASLAALAQDGGDSLRLEDILKAWEARTQQTTALRYEWTQETTERAAGLAMGSGMLTPVFVQRPEFDTESVTHSQEHSFRAAPDFVWHRRVGEEWAVDLQRFLKKSCWTCFDSTGNTNICADLTGTTQKVFPESAPIVAFVNKNPNYGNLTSGPIMLHHWPLNERRSPMYAPNLKLTADRKTIQSHPCARVAEWDTSYWVDFQAPFLVRLVETVHESGPAFRMEIDYRQDASGAWLIHTWRMENSFDRGQKPTTIVVATVSRAELNGVLEPKAELATIPVGAQVNASRDGKLHRYVHLADGRKREITDADSEFGNLTYEELVASELGQGYPPAWIALYKLLQPIRTMPAADRDAALVLLKQYLKDNRLLLRHWELVRSTAERLYLTPEPEAAVRMCRDFADEFPQLRTALLKQAQEFEAQLRYDRLIGKELSLTGKTVDGQPFDWEKYRGKTVLVNFWMMGCIPCVDEMPLLKKMHEKYQASGFDIVGVNPGEDLAEVQAFFAKHGIGWTNILDPGEGEDSNVARYHIHGYPTNIIVDRNGKVTALDTTPENLEDLIKAALEGAPQN